MKIMRKIIEIDEERCDGCGQCVIACAEGAIDIIDGKAKLISEIYCDGLGACLGECPQGAIQIIEREAADFDPEAVEHHLKERELTGKAAPQNLPHACPSSQVQVFQGARSQQEPGGEAASPSALSHWPVQIHLVPPTAHFLKGADLLVAADCTPVAYAQFHRDFLKGRVVLLGCPKFDDVTEYVKKFAEIFRTAEIRSVTVLIMEVPCCSALPMIVRKGMEAAGKAVPLEEIVIGARGAILRRERSAA
jgi:NAD-dependent dihydropyrimidine dehydrogenase PreA subunit